MILKKLFGNFKPWDWCLWGGSVACIIASYLICGSDDVLTLISSLIGIPALIFIAKGNVVGQFLMVAFAIFYGIISFFFAYYGEMITYLCMSAPIAVLSIITWLRHPFEKSNEVQVNHVKRWQWIFMFCSAAVVTTAFFFILRALGNENLIFSTISVATSYIAAFLTMLRSSLYAIGYALNDIVLIVLWVLAAIQDLSYLPMVICFALFLINDCYGFINWHRMKVQQRKVLINSANT